MTLTAAYRLSRFARARKRLARRGPLYVAYPEERGSYGPYRGQRAGRPAAHATGCRRAECVEVAA